MEKFTNWLHYEDWFNALSPEQREDIETAQDHMMRKGSIWMPPWAAQPEHKNFFLKSLNRKKHDF